MTPVRRTALGTRAAGVAVVLLIGCGGAAPAPRQRGPGGEVPVRVAEVARRTVPFQLHAIGNVVASSTVAVEAQVGGVLEEVHFREGQEVNRGQLLFTIDPRPFQNALRQAEAQLAHDRAQLVNAEAVLARYRELVKDDFVTKEQFDQATATVDSLKATIDQDQAAVANARVDLGYCTITAPIAGRTGELLVHAGNLVKTNESSPLVVINRIRPVDVVFSVPELRLDAIRRRQSQHPLPVTAHLGGDPSARAEGVLELIDNTVDTSTGTIMLKARFANSDETLWPGQFADVTVTLGEQEEAIVIPTRAVQSAQQGSFVFVLKPDGTVKSRPIEIDRTLGEETVVRSGLESGETVVTEGQLRLTSGVRVTIKAAPTGPTPAPAGPQG